MSTVLPLLATSDNDSQILLETPRLHADSFFIAHPPMDSGTNFNHLAVNEMMSVQILRNLYTRIYLQDISVQFKVTGDLTAAGFRVIACWVPWNTPLPTAKNAARFINSQADHVNILANIYQTLNGVEFKCRFQNGVSRGLKPETQTGGSPMLFFLAEQHSGSGTATYSVEVSATIVAEGASITDGNWVNHLITQQPVGPALVSPFITEMRALGYQVTVPGEVATPIRRRHRLPSVDDDDEDFDAHDEQSRAPSPQRPTINPVNQ